MGINAGASAITGVYLGDQLLTKGGGRSATENIQAAIDAPDTVELVHYIQGPDSILTSPAAMTAIANDKPSLDVLVSSQRFNQMVQYYPEIRAILDQSPYKADYIPGPLTLKKGDQQRGYFGEAQSSEFGVFRDGSQIGKGLDATTLAAQLNITQGSTMNNTITWHKFYWQSDIWYIASKAIRHSITWVAINAAGAVTGNTPLKLTKGTFYPYLLTGGVYSDSQDIGAGGNNMWDKLLRPLLSGGFWGTNYTDNQLDFRNSGEGYYHWCQETNRDHKQLRYGSGGAGAFADGAIYTTSTRGWRPALRFKLS